MNAILVFSYNIRKESYIYFMISLNELRIGNWISLRMPGSLIAAHKILDKDEWHVSIANGMEYSLMKRNESGKYIQQPKIELIRPRDLKGVPLSVEILTSCGFQLAPTNPEKPLNNYYLLEGFTVISSGTAPKYTFTDKSGNVPVIFVHDLQNLYFQQKDRELDITIPSFNFQMSK